MPLLTDFILRLSFGLALSMAATSSVLVPAGYFRVHSYVLLGLNALATLVALAEPGRYALWPPLAGAITSYVASAVWLYEKPRPGKMALLLVAGTSLAGAWLVSAASGSFSTAARWLSLMDDLSGGLLLGTTMAAMLLGHWYLNTPTMQLAPLRRLVGLMAAAAVLRGVVCGLGLVLSDSSPFDTATWLLIGLRWLAGILGTLLVAGMTWQTLKVPNTQSATGILYVGVIVSFLGELTAGLLSAESLLPL